MAIGTDFNTTVSGNGSVNVNPAGMAAGATNAAPGSTGPASNMAPATAMLWIIFGSMAGLFVLGYAFRKGGS